LISFSAVVMVRSPFWLFCSRKGYAVTTSFESHPVRSSRDYCSLHHCQIWLESPARFILGLVLPGLLCLLWVAAFSIDLYWLFS